MNADFQNKPHDLHPTTTKKTDGHSGPRNLAEAMGFPFDSDVTYEGIPLKLFPRVDVDKQAVTS